MIEVSGECDRHYFRLGNLRMRTAGSRSVIQTLRGCMRRCEKDERCRGFNFFRK